jgi:3-hydroxybutyryl-CoA dehydrogenase
MSEHAIQRVAVIGAGRMGTGIAQVCAMSGIPTTLVDHKPANAKRARRTIREALDRAVGRWRLSPDDRDRAQQSLTLGTLADLAEIDLVIEAVPEDFDTKVQLFRDLRAAAPDALLATSTRTLSVTDLGEAADLPDLVALHFVHPVPRTGLIEVIGPAPTWRVLKDFAMRLGKVPIAARDRPGFIVDRVSQPLFLEAGRMRAEGMAETAQLDDCLSTALGAPMGPFEQTDLAGTDVAADLAERLWRALGQPARLEPDPKVAELAAAGRLGWRSGRGFYNYPRPAPEMPEAVNEVGPFMELLAHVCPIATTDGRTAAERAGDKGLALLDVAPAPFMERPSLAFTAAGLDAATKRELFKTAGHEGIALVEVPDTPGLVALRAASVLVNEAAYAAADGVADLDDIDRALQLGLSWTVGPKRLSKWFAPSISRTLAALEARDGRGRYTPAAGVG